MTLAEAAGWSAVMVSDYRQSKARVQAEGRHIARIVAEHARHTLASADIVLNYVNERVDQEGISGLTGPSAAKQIRETIKATPQVASVTVLDAEGRSILSSQDVEAASVDIAGREIFQALKDGLVELHIGESNFSEANGLSRFTCGLRLQASGAFAGVALVTIDVDYFREFYRSLELPFGWTIALHRLDGLLIVRSPPSPDHSGYRMAGSSLFTMPLPDQPAGVFEMNGSDEVRRTIAYRRIEGLPLVAIAGIPHSMAMAAFNSRLVHDTLIGLGVWAMLLVLGLLGFASLRRETVARGQLEMAKASLEHRVAERTRDLTQAVAERQRALEAAERADHAKSRFLAAASHDLRQPLQAIRLFLDVLSGRPLPERDQAVVAKAAEALEGGEDLLRALLDVSALEAGMVKPQTQRFAVQTILAQMAAECADQARAKGLEFVVCPSRALIESDPLLLQRMVRNLVANAIRHVARGRILLGCRRAGRELRIEVWDSGPGIPPDKLDAIFEDFFQLSNPERDRSRGLGLGLSIVERTARLLGHRIGVRSVLGKGSVFWIAVPLATDEAREG